MLLLKCEKLWRERHENKSKICNPIRLHILKQHKNTVFSAALECGRLAVFCKRVWVLPSPFLIDEYDILYTVRLRCTFAVTVSCTKKCLIFFVFYIICILHILKIWCIIINVNKGTLNES